MPLSYDAAPHVRATSGPDGTVLLDLQRGKYLALNVVGSLVWEALTAGASRSQAVDALMQRFPDVPAERLAHDTDVLLGQLQARGLVRPRGAAESASAAPAEAPATKPCRPIAEAHDEAGRSWTRALWIPVAYGALLIADTLLGVLGFSRFHRLVRRIPQRRCGRRATRVRSVVASVDMAAGFYFKRAWCLQRSAVTVGLLRLAGFPARLVIGVQRLPFYAHAWVEVEGDVVNERASVRQDFEVLEIC